MERGHCHAHHPSQNRPTAELITGNSEGARLPALRIRFPRWPRSELFLTKTHQRASLSGAAGASLVVGQAHRRGGPLPERYKRKKWPQGGRHWGHSWARHALGKIASSQSGSDVLGGLDLNIFRRLLSLRFFGQRHVEHTVFEGGLDLVRIDALWNTEASFEGAKFALVQIIVLLFFFFFFLLLALDGEVTISDFHLDIFLIHSRHFGFDFVSLLALDDVNGWGCTPSLFTPP